LATWIPEEILWVAIDALIFQWHLTALQEELVLEQLGPVHGSSNLPLLEQKLTEEMI
jgi:hypothetical protein